jgi:sulfoxide reductase heme-binding subunit YedZ
MSLTALKALVFVACLAPAAVLVAQAALGALGANPIDKVTDVTGTWTLRFLLITLAVTPVRRLTGWNAVIRYRRMLGLFAFFYGCLHLLTYGGLDQFFAFDHMASDVAKRPFITAGAAAFLLMLPLAATSTAGWMRRLGGRNWQRLHRLAYVSAVGGVVHYYWLVKADTSRPVRYALLLALLLTVRVWSRLTAAASASRRGPGPAELAR